MDRSSAASARKIATRLFTHTPEYPHPGLEPGPRPNSLLFLERIRRRSYPFSMPPAARRQLMLAHSRGARGAIHFAKRRQQARPHGPHAPGPRWPRVLPPTRRAGAPPWSLVPAWGASHRTSRAPLGKHRPTVGQPHHLAHTWRTDSMSISHVHVSRTHRARQSITADLGDVPATDRPIGRDTPKIRSWDHDNRAR